MDIAFTKPDSSMKEIPLELTGGVLKGIELLGQRVILALCTNISGVLRGSEGSTLGNTLGSVLVTEDSAYMALGTAISVISESLREDEDRYDDSEKLGSIIIDSVSIDTDRLVFTITVTNALGGTVSTSGEAYVL